MQKDIYYYKPEKPTFRFNSRTGWVEKVLVIRYIDGEIDSFLSDSLGWMKNEDFEIFRKEIEPGPFYGIYKEGNGELFFGDQEGYRVKNFIKTDNDMGEFLNSAERTGCPIADSLEKLNEIAFK